MKVFITIFFLFLLPCNTVTYTQETFNTQTMDKDKKARQAEFNSALSDLTTKDIKRAKDFQAWINSWMTYVDTGLQPHPTHKPPF